MNPDDQSYREIELAGFILAQGSGAYVLDVRESAEYAQCRVPGAVLMPMGTVPDRVGELPPDTRIYVVCAVGGRSGRVTEYLRARGIDAVNVAGGTEAWLRAGNPVEHG